MPTSVSRADALLRGDPHAVEDIAARLIKPLNNNLVERPWGGRQMLTYKGMRGSAALIPAPGMGFGEAFEIAAYDEDDEARRYPSRLQFADGSELTLQDLLERHGERILGEAFISAHGSRMPLLPKTLDIVELLSVQGHPPGNTEVYIIIAAEPGATIGLGFRNDIDHAAFAEMLRIGRRQQAEVLALLGDHFDADRLQAVLRPWFADREAAIEALRSSSLGERFCANATRNLLAALKQLYWRVLDAMNTVPVEAGQVIHNATPPRLLGGGTRLPSAEVHALGNPEGREILALEIRRPGPTFRAWDNVRFPLRDIDIDAALDSLNLKATTAADFAVEPVPLTGRPGVYCSVDSAAFRIEHLRPRSGLDIPVERQPPHCLHAIRGQVNFSNASGEDIGALGSGESALVPVGVGAYTLCSAGDDAEVIKASLAPTELA